MKNINFLKLNRFKSFNSFNPIRKNFAKIYSEKLLLQNKEFSTNFKESTYFNFFYDINLKHSLNSLFMVKKEIKKIVFVGPNPNLFLEKIPPSKIK
jgi:hypothetical protein